MFSVIAASSTALAQAEPVGGSIASSFKSFRVDKGFGQHDGLLIHTPPILRQAPANPSQKKGGQVRHLHPGQNQKPVVVDQLLQAQASLHGGPSDERIPCSDFPGRRTESS